MNISHNRLSTNDPPCFLNRIVDQLGILIHVSTAINIKENMKNLITLGL